MFADSAKAIETRFKTMFEVKRPGILIVFDNDGQQITGGKTHAELTILNSVSNRIDLGDHRLHRLLGIINVNIFFKVGMGTREALAIADDVADIFRDKQFDGVLCRSPVTTRIGEGGTFFQVNVSVPFQYDEAFTD